MGSVAIPAAKILITLFGYIFWFTCGWAIIYGKGELTSGGEAYKRPFTVFPSEKLIRWFLSISVVITEAIPVK